MITRDLLEQLHCPYCGSRLDLEMQIQAGEGGVRNGIVRCGCYRYPVIEGILILRQRSAPSNIRDEGVARLEAGDVLGALQHAFFYDSPIPPNRAGRERAIDFLKRRVGRLFHRNDNSGQHLLQPAATFRDALYLYRPTVYANYLLHRYSNNSFLAAIPLLLLLKELGGESRRVLDLNCGAGHASFLIQTLFPHLSVIASDHDFVNLYLAKSYLIPQSPCLCLDAEFPLPFNRSYFDAILCLDGLHYVRSKRALLKELDRIAKEMGIWLFPHLHNALVHNVAAGVPLKPFDYRGCFDFIPSRLLIESEVFRNFMLDQRLDLTASPGAEPVEQAPVFSMVASRRTDLWRNHDDLAEWFLQKRPNLAINPIYERNGHGEGIHLRMAWPSSRLEAECQSVKAFLPQECDIDPTVWRRMKSGSLREADHPVVERLMKSFVLVPLPERYV